MRILTTLVLVTVCAIAAGLAPRPAAAEDVNALRKELDELRAQQQRYQKMIEALGERLQRLEAQPPPTASGAVAPPSPPVTPVTTAPVTPAVTTSAAQTQGTQPQTTPLSPADLLRPRPPFALSPQRGAGQLLFDMGVTGDFVGGLTRHNVEKANGGTFRGRENRFFPREVELNLFGQVDPFARADVRIEAGEDTPGTETSVSLAEATITLLALPYGTQAKFGQLRNRFGWSNVVHEHDLPWIDRPDVYRMFLGEDGFKEKGVEATWVPDFLPFYVEALGGIFDGDNGTAFGRGRLTSPLVTGRVRTYFDLTDTNAIQIGASVANGETRDRLRSTLIGYDLRYKYRPEGWLFPLVTLSSEGIYSIRRTEVSELVDTDGDGVPETEVFGKRTRERFGWYGWGELRPLRRWAFGARYDATEYPVIRGRQWAVEPYVTLFPSEFLRFRVGYKHTERTKRDGFSLNGGSARDVDELLFQGTFVLGAHPAHEF